MNKKQILLYSGATLFLGTVSFFVWSFFKKPKIDFDNTTISFNSANTTDEISKIFPNQSIDKGFSNGGFVSQINNDSPMTQELEAIIRGRL